MMNTGLLILYIVLSSYIAIEHLYKKSYNKYVVMNIILSLIIFIYGLIYNNLASMIISGQVIYVFTICIILYKLNLRRGKNE